MAEGDRLQVSHSQRFGRAGKVFRRAGYTLARLRHSLQTGCKIISRRCRKRDRGLQLNHELHDGEAIEEEEFERPFKKQHYQVDIQARADFFTPSVTTLPPGSDPSPLGAPSAPVGTDKQNTRAQDAQSDMSARKLKANGRTVGQRLQSVQQRLQIIVDRQAAAELSHQSAMKTAAEHLPGFNFGRNTRHGPVSTAERSVGGRPFERVVAGSAVLVSQASDGKKAQQGAPDWKHVHGAMSRQELVPQVPRLADRMAHAPPMDLRVLSQTAAARDAEPLGHNEAASEEALFSHPNPAASSEQLVHVSMPSSTGTAAVPGGAVLPGSGTGLQHQVGASMEPAGNQQKNAAVEPAVESVISPRQHPFQRKRTAAAPTGAWLRADGMVMHPMTMDLRVLSQTAAARDAEPLGHNEAVSEEALYSHPNPAASSEQLVQVIKPSSIGRAAVPRGVLPGSSTGLHHQVDATMEATANQQEGAAVEPAVESVGSPRQHPFQRKRTAAAPTGTWLRADGMLMNPITMDEVLRNQEWDAEEVMIEQPARAGSLQSRGKAAQPEAAGAMAPLTNPAIQPRRSFGGADGHGRDPDDFSSGGRYYGPEPSGDDHSYGCPGRSVDDASPDYSSVSSLDSGYSGADSASSVGNGMRTSSVGGSSSGGKSSGGKSSGRRSSGGGSHVDEAAADSGLAPVAPSQRRVAGEEQGRGAASEAGTSGRVTAKEEASRFLADLGLSFAVEAPDAQTVKGSQGVGGVPMRGGPQECSETLLQADNYLHDRRLQVNLECDDPVADADMEEDQYPDDELGEYVDTTPISWAPTVPAFLAPAATGLPFPSQHADLGMPPIPPPPKPAGFPAAAESGSAHQPWEHGKIPSRGGQKRKHQDSLEGGKRRKVSGGAASTAQLGSNQAPTLEGLSGGTASAEQQGSAPANAMQGSAVLGTDVAATEVAGGEASTAQQGSDPAPTVGWGGPWKPRHSGLAAAADALRARTLMLQQQK